MKSRKIGRKPGQPPRILLADDSRLVFSDDYRMGWKWGFESIGCTVQVVDIGELRRSLTRRGVPSILSVGRDYFAKPMAENVASWQPDLVFAHHGRAASNEGFINRLCERNVKTATYLCDEPYETGETAGYSPAIGQAL